MKKKMFSVLLVILGLSVVFASGQQSKGPEKVTLTIAGRDGSYGEAMQIAVDAYSAAHPEVSFEVLKLSGGSLFEKTVIDMKSGLGTYDVILVDDPNITQFQKVGWLADLDKLYKAAGTSPDSDFIGSALKLGRYPYKDSGTLYALPHAGNVELFAYRHDLFKKYGLNSPEKWDDVLKAAQVIGAGEEGVSGVVFRGTKGNPVVTGFLPMFWSFGAKL